MHKHDSLTKDERASMPVDSTFNRVDPLVLNEHEEASVSRQANLVDINGWLLYVHEARALRDWLNKVLP